jgi:hypothetical protein
MGGTYGRRHELIAMVDARSRWTLSASWKSLWIVGLIVAIVLFVILHLLSGGFVHH